MQYSHEGQQYLQRWSRNQPQDQSNFEKKVRFLWGEKLIYSSILRSHCFWANSVFDKCIITFPSSPLKIKNCLGGCSRWSDTNWRLRVEKFILLYVMANMEKGVVEVHKSVIWIFAVNVNFVVPVLTRRIRMKKIKYYYTCCEWFWGVNIVIPTSNSIWKRKAPTTLSVGVRKDYDSKCVFQRKKWYWK